MRFSDNYTVGEIILLNSGETTYDRLAIVTSGNSSWEPPYAAAYPWIAFRTINNKCQVIPEDGIEKKLSKEEAETLVLGKLHDDDVKYNFVQQMEKAVLEHKKRGDLALALVRDNPEDITKDE